ncbi:MAG TPA: M3 family metallopeptidase [Spirochaetota bacterium]|nr:M3 family metallopeptidase [Spirochaetota bacterium]
MKKNPLLQSNHLPCFDLVKAVHIKPAVKQVLRDCKKRLRTLLKQPYPDFNNFIIPYMHIVDDISYVWGVVEHLNAVKNTPAIRKAYTRIQSRYINFMVKLKQNRHFYRIFSDIKKKFTLEPVQQKVIDDALLQFKLSGTALGKKRKSKFRRCQKQLSAWQNKFQNNVLDAVKNYTLTVNDPEPLKELPEHVLKAAHHLAVNNAKAGPGSRVWQFTLDIPSFLPFMKFCTDPALREKLYRAYVTRAASGKIDNTEIISKILKVRQQQAELLGFANYAVFSLQDKMAADPDRVNAFLDELFNKSAARAWQDAGELNDFKQKTGGKGPVKAWDLLFYREKLRLEKYAINEKVLRQYFSLDQVLSGLFDIIEKLFGHTLKKSRAAVWHQDVLFYVLYNDNQEESGYIYFDLYSRPDKRSGAWMDVCRSRRFRGKKIFLPAAYLNCNFTAPAADQPVLLTFNEVVTLFHEMGHVLNHVLTRIDYPAVSGLEGIPWDGIELASQLLENWAYEKEVLDKFAFHYQTREPLPPELVKGLKAGKTFFSGYDMLRQLLFSKIDMDLHYIHKGKADESPAEFIKKIRDKMEVIPSPPENRFENSFLHIFSGGYAAGYYSYKWAEVLAADAFSLFKQNGLWDRKTGKRFLDLLLSKGGSEDYYQMFIDFRGRPPDREALLRQYGIIK